MLQDQSNIIPMLEVTKRRKSYDESISSNKNNNITIADNSRNNKIKKTVTSTKNSTQSGVSSNLNQLVNDELRKIYNHHFKHELQIEGNNYIILITSVHFGDNNKDVRPKNLNVEPEEDDQVSFSETEKKNFDKREELALTTPRLEKKPSITTSSRIPNLQLLSLTRRNSRLSMPMISGRKNEVSISDTDPNHNDP
jgi:hypothetical protein